MPITLSTNDPDSQQYLVKIGEIMVKFSLLEQVIELWIWELIDANGLAAKKQSIGSSVTMHLEYHEKIELLRLLVIERGSHLFSANQFSPIIDGLKDNDKNRTRLTHSMWFIGNKRQASVSTNRHGGKQGKPVDFEEAVKSTPIQDLEKISNSLDESHDALMEFMGGLIRFGTSGKPAPD